jgi:hypothetical protein
MASLTSQPFLLNSFGEKKTRYGRVVNTAKSNICQKMFKPNVAFLEKTEQNTATESVDIIPFKYYSRVINQLIGKAIKKHSQLNK